MRCRWIEEKKKRPPPPVVVAVVVAVHSLVRGRGVAANRALAPIRFRKNCEVDENASLVWQSRRTRIFPLVSLDAQRSSNLWHVWTKRDHARPQSHGGKRGRLCSAVPGVCVGGEAVEWGRWVRGVDIFYNFYFLFRTDDKFEYIARQDHLPKH